MCEKLGLEKAKYLKKKKNSSRLLNDFKAFLLPGVLDTNMKVCVFFVCVFLFFCFYTDSLSSPTAVIHFKVTCDRQMCSDAEL